MADFYNDEEACRAFRAMPYREYLQTPWWRRRSDRRIRQAGSRCERCGGRSRLESHHRTKEAYERLGAERDIDLEVLCRDCHEGTHVDETRRHNLGVYLKLASETLRLDQPTNVADFKEALIRRCKSLKIPLDHRVDDAISATQGRLSLAREARRQEVKVLLDTLPELPPITKSEAIALCRKLRVPIPFRSMPSTYGVGSGVAAVRARAAAQLKAAACPQCKRTGACLSRVQPGSLWCSACQHRWEMPIDQGKSG
jgi:hypothetical protein